MERCPRCKGTNTTSENGAVTCGSCHLSVTQDQWMAMCNSQREPIKVFHKNLKPVEESAFKTKCPCCEHGVLLMYRQSSPPYTLRAEDWCIVCGMPFIYQDIEVLRARETPTAKEQQ